MAERLLHKLTGLITYRPNTKGLFVFSYSFFKRILFMETQIIDRQTVEHLEKLLGDNFQVLVSTFEEDAIIKVSSARRYCDSQHWPELSKTIHSLKGACLNIGANQMVSLCLKIEAILRDENFTALDAIVDQLETHLIDLKAALHEIKVI